MIFVNHPIIIFVIVFIPERTLSGTFLPLLDEMIICLSVKHARALHRSIAAVEPKKKWNPWE